MNNGPIVIEQSYQASVENVWKAITDKDAMKQWYFDFLEFKPEVGFEFQFMGGPAEDRQYLHKCRISEVSVGKKLAYSWCYEGYEGESVVTFELFPAEDQTKLRLTHEGLETFPVNQPDLDRQNFVIGWNWIIGTSLKDYLEKV